MPEFIFDIREGVHSDAEGIAAVHLDSLQSISSRRYSVEILEELISPVKPERYGDAMDQGAVFYVAEDDTGRVIGFSEVHRVEKAEFNCAVFVAGKVERNGVGTALYAKAEAHAIHAGARLIALNSSLVAVDFYRANGFSTVEPIQLKMQCGQFLEAVHMRKDLKNQKTKQR